MLRKGLQYNCYRLALSFMNDVLYVMCLAGVLTLGKKVLSAAVLLQGCFPWTPAATPHRY